MCSTAADWKHTVFSGYKSLIIVLWRNTRVLGYAEIPRGIDKCYDVISSAHLLMWLIYNKNALTLTNSTFIFHNSVGQRWLSALHLTWFIESWSTKMTVKKVLFMNTKITSGVYRKHWGTFKSLTS